MLPSKVMPYLLRLAAPLMDSLIVQLDWILLKGKTFEEYSNSNLVYIFEILAMRGDQGPKKGLTDAAIMLCKLNKSLEQSSIKVGIHRQKVCIP